MNSKAVYHAHRSEKDIDPVSLYLSEISQHPLLDPEEELDLARQVATGSRAQELLAEQAGSGTDRLTADEWDCRDQWELQVITGRQAHDRLIKSNLRLVVSVAKNHLGRGLSLLDLIQEGNLGLLHAVEKFDYTLGYRLSTYATWWIRQTINRAIADKARSIRLPVHIIESMNRQSRVQRELLQSLGRKPTPREIAVQMELLDNNEFAVNEDGEECSEPMTDDSIRRLRRASKKVRTLQLLNLEPLSLDSPVADDEGSCLGDFIVDENLSDPIEIASRQALAEEMESLLGALNERERSVLIMRFGLDDAPARTLEDIGRDLKVTRERVRQIQARALRKLRMPKHSHKLTDYAR